MKLQSIDQKIVKRLKSSNDISIKYLGGIDYLHQNFSEVSSSKFLSEILKAISDEFNNLEEEEQYQGKDVITNALEQCNNEFSIQEVLSIAFNISSEISISCFQICLIQSCNTEKHPLVRAWLLEASFKFALLNRTRRFNLLDNLINTSIDDCPEYLRHFTKILGLAYSNWQETDLIDKLLELRDSNLGEDEVWFELGMSYLLNALNSQEYEKASQNFLLAKDHFEKSIEIGSERPDAEAYFSALLILTSLSDPNNTLDYKKLIEKMSRSLTIYNAWHISQEESEWVSARNIEITNWYTLVNKLEHLLVHLNEPSWFEPRVVIETYLLNIYRSSRTIFKRDKDGGLEKIIQPKIEGKLINQTSKIYLINEWIKSQDDSEIKIIGLELKENLQKINPFQQHYSNEYSGMLKDFRSELPYDSKGVLDQFIEDCTSVSEKEINPILERLLIEIFNKVESNSSYNIERVRKGFHILVNQLISFLESRMNGTLKDNKRLAYLFKNEQLPLEVTLQDDLHEYLYGNLINANVEVEKSNIASGRVDVNVSFGAFNFPIEIKRDSRDCSFEAIRSKYLGQGAEYLNTNVKLGFLMILDLTDKPYGMRSIESNVKVEILNKTNEASERAIVVIVIPGNRITPSLVRIENTQH